ncbi:MAG: PAS domain-containing protein [Pseudomonadales bacterium]|nr:PAS domain-containing protein [Pseudomonadales bacterium]NIX09599.1 PAS domain-containing protein [Pseudomonadales bacterium]
MPSLAKTDILDQLTGAVIVCDASLRVCYMNPAAESLLNTSEHQSTGVQLAELLFEDAVSPFADLSEIFNTEQSITKRAAELQLRDGTDVVADLTASLEPRSGHLVIELQPLNRLLRINRDEHSFFSQQTTRTLIRGLAHEVKNPLGGLRGAAQLLQRELEGSELTEYTRIIIAEADRLTQLVDSMLGSNRQPEYADVNIHELLEHVVRLVDAELGGRVSFLRDYDPSLPPIRADRAQLVQALINIVRNAGQALRETVNPDITLKTRAVRQFTIGATRHRVVIQIEIADNGPGIPEEMIDRIWFPMISGRAEGTGLGLAITQSIVGHHNGIIECASRRGDTRFSVFLPVESNGEQNGQLEDSES